MKTILLFLPLFLLFSACSKEPKCTANSTLLKSNDVKTKKTIVEKKARKKKLCIKKSIEQKDKVVQKVTPKYKEKRIKQKWVSFKKFRDLEGFRSEDFKEIFEHFKRNCKKGRVAKFYKNLCYKAEEESDARFFIVNNFEPKQIKNTKRDNIGLLTGYYEAQIRASYQLTKRYKYPIYATPQDLVEVDLSAIYPELKGYRLRGRLEGKRLIPYYSRQESKHIALNAPILCYCDSKIDRFFLEIQGSGIAKMEDNSTINIGYANQNGHKYRAIGRYLINIGALKKEEVSMQSIREWLKKHPQRVDEVLNYNSALVFFSKREQGATGALGVELTPYRSVAVDRRYIPLGSMLYLDAQVQEDRHLCKVVFAEDTGGAIRGKVRADLFVGHGKEAESFAGQLKAPLKLWLLVPKER
jgi:membrane-bound lytic murein transglycosylase A